MNIAEQTLAKRTIAWMAAILVLLGGYISYEKLGRFEDPEFVIRQAAITTLYPGAMPEQVAQEVTLGDVLGTDVVVHKGLQGGEQIVVAGVSQLREAMLVRSL